MIDRARMKTSSHESQVRCTTACRADHAGAGSLDGNTVAVTPGNGSGTSRDQRPHCRGDRIAVICAGTVHIAPECQNRRDHHGELNLAVEIIRSACEGFRASPSGCVPPRVLRLHSAALEGLHPLAGTYRNTPVKIGGSKHKPPEAAMVAEEIEHLCEYVNDNWKGMSAEHLSAYVLWKLNRIHPFADGNGSHCESGVLCCDEHQAGQPASRHPPPFADQIAGNKAPYYEASLKRPIQLYLKQDR